MPETQISETVDWRADFFVEVCEERRTGKCVDGWLLATKKDLFIKDRMTDR